MDVKNVLKYVIGWSFIILGIIGLFLPVFQGVLMILAGIAVLESEKEVKLYSLA